MGTHVEYVADLYNDYAADLYNDYAADLYNDYAADLYNDYAAEQYNEDCLEQRLDKYLDACRTCRMRAQRDWSPIDGYGDMGSFFMQISDILREEVV